VPASPLTELLAAAQAALERNDPAALAEATGAAARTCADMAARGLALEPEELGSLRRQHALLEARALDARDLAASRLGRVGRSRRAVQAYGRRRPG
jgi:hypothetical protein